MFNVKSALVIATVAAALLSSGFIVLSVPAVNDRPATGDVARP